MDNCNVAEMDYRQSTITFLKLKLEEKVITCITP